MPQSITVEKRPGIGIARVLVLGGVGFLCFEAGILVRNVNLLLKDYDAYERWKENYIQNNKEGES